MENVKVQESPGANEPGTFRVMPTEQYFALIRQTLADRGEAFVRVTGVSMLPLLRHLKDGVIIAPPRGIRPGDIVLFDRRSGRYALHRVIHLRGDRFDMAGDNQWFIERGLPCDQVIGVVTAIVRGGKRISCQNFFLKIHARAVTSLTELRINIRRAVGKLVKPFRRAGTEHRRRGRG